MHCPFDYTNSSLFITNAACLGWRLNVNCKKKHTHRALLNGRAHHARIYPRKLCEVIVKGILDQKHLDDNCLGFVRSVKSESEVKVKEAQGSAEKCHEPITEWAIDDVTGGRLDPALVRKARLLEIEYCKSRDIARNVPVSKCWKMTGKDPIGVRWIDHNKGDDVNLDIRCRIVAQEYNNSKEEGLFAGTPPLEALKILIGDVTTSKWKEIAIHDISRAFFYAKAMRPVYVKIPEEARVPGEDPEDCDRKEHGPRHECALTLIRLVGRACG